MQQDTRIVIARLEERLRALDRLLEEREKEREKQVRIALVNADRAVEKADAALERIEALERGEAGGKGHAGGMKDSWATIISVLSLAATLVMAIFYLSHWAGK